MAYVAPIVEGHGEVEALPVLLRRVAAASVPDIALKLSINHPFRVNAKRFLGNDEEFNRVIELAARKAKANGGFVLILLDCEDSCPGELGPSILQRAQAVRGNIPMVVALAYREFESWFLAAARSLRGHASLPADLEPPGDSTSMRDAKGWLSHRMGNAYQPTMHQLDLCRIFDLQEARANASFARFHDRIVEAMKRCNGP